jgi:hypothetical protein
MYFYVNEMFAKVFSRLTSKRALEHVNTLQTFPFYDAKHEKSHRKCEECLIILEY